VILGRERAERNFRHVRAIPWTSRRWRARRRIDTGHSGQLHSRECARGHVQPRCRGGGCMERGDGCRRRHRSGGGPPASRDAHGRGRHSATQHTCARRTGRSKRRTDGRVGPTARDEAPLTAPPDGVRNRSRAAAAKSGAQTRLLAGPHGRVEPRKSLRVVSGRHSGRWGGAGGQGPSGPCVFCGWTVLLSYVTPFAVSVIASL